MINTSNATIVIYKLLSKVNFLINMLHDVAI